MKQKTQLQIDKIMNFRVSQAETYNSYNKFLFFNGGGANDYTVNVMITQYPTNNCQLSSIGEMRSIIRIRKNASRKLYYFAHKLRKYTQRQILIDVPESNYKDVIDRLSPYTNMVNHFSYISTNNSRMHLAVLKWTI